MGFGGGGKFANVGATDLPNAKLQVDICKGHGVNFIDTADVYSNGVSEEIVGEALRGQRDDWVIGTKVRFPTGVGPNDEGLSRHHITRAAEASLKRLGTDWIDLYQVHQWDGQTPLDETLEALDTLVRHGKVRYIGASNYSCWHLMKALGISQHQHLSRFVSQQIHYSLHIRDAETELLPAASDQGLGVLVWSPLAGGLLSGKYSRGKDGQIDGPAGSRQMTEWSEPPIDYPDRLFATIEVLKSTANERQASVAQVALAWVLSRKTVSSVIIGARNRSQLEDNLNSANVTLTESELAELEKVSRPPLPYPYWHQRDTVSSRLSEADKVLLSSYTN